MILAPYSVVWAFVLATSLFLILGMAWLGFNEGIARVFRHLWLSDGVALWLLFTAVYHSIFFLRGPYREILGDPTGVWILWGALAAYLIVRLAPTPLRNPTAGLALAILTWGWVLGAGYSFVELMEGDARLLRENPNLALSPTPGAYAPLARARFFVQMNPEDRSLVEKVLAHLERGENLDTGLASLARLELVPQLLAYYELELRRLGYYQIFQAVLLAGVLVVWGFGARSWERD